MKMEPSHKKKSILQWMAVLAGCVAAFFVGKKISTQSELPSQKKDGQKPALSALVLPADEEELTPFARAVREFRPATSEPVELNSVAELKAWFNSLEDGASSPPGTWEKMEKWAELDPEGAWNWLASGGKRKLKQLGVEQSIIRKWIAKDPAAAMEALLTCPSDESGMKSGAANAAFQALILMDGGVPDLDVHLDALLELGAIFKPSSGGAEPADRLKTLQANGEKYLQLPDGKAKSMILTAMTGALAHADFSAAQSWIAKLPPSIREAATRQMIVTLLRSSANSISTAPGYSSGWEASESATKSYESNMAESLAFVKDWFESESSAVDRTAMGALIAKKLAEQDPAAALAWSYEKLSGRNLSKSIGAIVAGQAKSDLVEAQAMVEALPPGQMQGRVATELAKTWAKKDPAAAIYWMLNVSEQGGSTSAASGLRSIARTWSFNDPNSARNFLVENSGDQLPERFVRSTIQGMTGKEPQATANWATQLPENSFRTQVLTETISDWINRTPSDATAWMASSEAPSDLPDSVYSSAGSRWFWRDPDAAVQWAGQLPPGSARVSAITQLKSALEKSSANPEKISRWRALLD